MTKITLERLIYKNYLKTSLTSIFFIELVLVGIYFLVNNKLIEKSTDFILRDLKENTYKLVDENYYFADKTIFIKDIIEESSQVLLIPRPRRFGKSLNMSMLKYFFTNKNAEENRELFNGLKIEKETEIMKLQGKYPLIYISFKDVKKFSWESCYNKTIGLIKNIFKEFLYLADTLNEIDKEDFFSIVKKQATQEDYENSFKFL